MKKTASNGLALDDVGQLMATLPGVVASKTVRGSSWKVKRKLLACTAMHKSAEPDSLVVHINMAERERLLAAKPEVYYLTNHYVPYPCILVRLKQVKRDELRNLMGIAAISLGSK